MLATGYNGMAYRLNAGASYPLLPPGASAKRLLFPRDLGPSGARARPAPVDWSARYAEICRLAWLNLVEAPAVLSRQRGLLPFVHRSTPSAC